MESDLDDRIARFLSSLSCNGGRDTRGATLGRMDLTQDYRAGHRDNGMSSRKMPALDNDKVRVINVLHYRATKGERISRSGFHHESYADQGLSVASSCSGPCCRIEIFESLLGADKP